jgi:competence protein ComEC
LRILQFFTVIFLLVATDTLAADGIPNQIEKIDLNLKSHEMAVTFLNLSKGDATLIQGPDGDNILVNMGEAESQKELENWLSLYHVKTISKLVLASGNDIPMPILKHLVSAYQINELFVPPSEKINRFHKTAISPLVTGTKVILMPELSAVVQFAGGGENEGLDFTLQFYQHRLFLMNSFSERAEQNLLKKNLGDIQIFKVPNCGPDETLSERLINHVNPQISILHGVNKDIIDDLYKTWSEIYFTKNNGTVTIKFTAKNYEVFAIQGKKD